MSLIIIVIISALFWTVQKGSELYTTYFKVALLKCHTSCKLVVFTTLQTTTTFCTFSPLNFPNMKHLCFTSHFWWNKRNKNWTLFQAICKYIYLKSNYFCIVYSVLIQEILYLKSNHFCIYQFSLDSDWLEFSMCPNDCQILPSVRFHPTQWLFSKF